MPASNTSKTRSSSGSALTPGGEMSVDVARRNPQRKEEVLSRAFPLACPVPYSIAPTVSEQQSIERRGRVRDRGSRNHRSGGGGAGGSGARRGRTLRQRVRVRTCTADRWLALPGRHRSRRGSRRGSASGRRERPPADAGSTRAASSAMRIATPRDATPSRCSPARASCSRQRKPGFFAIALTAHRGFGRA